jgi:hypothetical protein
MFKRMLNHMEMVEKARLCHRLEPHDDCLRSHSYREVMTYNPLFKRLTCRQPSHYLSDNVNEPLDCVCIHVDTGLEWDWMDDQKSKYCPRGSRCTSSRCLKSHSFEEVCWYNPVYKTRQCSAHRSDPPPDCAFYHSATDQRDLYADADHVGRAERMLFPERTHMALADILDAMRLQAA